MCEIQSQEGEPWNSKLAHICAGAAEGLTEDSRRLSLLFAMTVYASLISDTVSGVERLLQHGTLRSHLSGDVDHWKKQLRGIQLGGPPWFAAKARGLLPSLELG